ncbi:MAG: hypothetical protein QXE01_00635 [Sulfolobales archaeon]
MEIRYDLPKYLIIVMLVSTMVFLGFQGSASAIGNTDAQEGSTSATNTTLNIPTTALTTNETVTNTSVVVTNTTPTPTNTSINATATNTSTPIGATAAIGVENVTANITTVTVISYITLPPVTRPPSNVEIARWLSGGVIAGILVGLSIGYAFFARGVSIKRQQVSGKGVRTGEKAEKRRK